MCISAGALLVRVCVRVCLFVCAYLRSAAFVALLSVCCCYQGQRARKPFSWRCSASSTSILLAGKRTHNYGENKCIAFASPLDAAQSRSTLAFALAAFSFVEGN